MTHQIHYWTVLVRVHPPDAWRGRPLLWQEVYNEELAAPYVADVAPSLVRKVELGEYCVLPDWSIAEVIEHHSSMDECHKYAASFREHIRTSGGVLGWVGWPGKPCVPEDVREMMTAE